MSYRDTHSSVPSAFRLLIRAKAVFSMRWFMDLSYRCPAFRAEPGLAGTAGRECLGEAPAEPGRDRQPALLDQADVTPGVPQLPRQLGHIQASGLPPASQLISSWSATFVDWQNGFRLSSWCRLSPDRPLLTRPNVHSP